MLISKKFSKPICSHFWCSVLIPKKITEPICSDFVFLKSARSVLAKKIIKQTVDFVGGLVLISKKFSIQIEPYRMVLFFG